jgi:HK97 family phage major capsid protein
MPSIKQLEDQGRALLEDQKRLVSEDTRPWDEKAAEFEAREADLKAIYKQHAALKAVDGSPFAALEDAEPREAQGKSLGEEVTSSDAYAKAVALKSSGERFSSALDVKATLTTAAGGAGLLQVQYLPGMTNVLFQRLTIADLIPSGQASGNSIIYMKESSVTNAAAAVAEGGTKPSSDINYSQVTETFKKVANVLKISDEMLQDVPYVQSQVSGRLVYFVQQQEEAQLLSGSGAGANLTGILNRSGLTAAQAKGTDTNADAIFKEITKIRTSAFVDPSAIVLNPTDWQLLRLAKDSQGQYYAGGPFTGAYGNEVSGNDRGNLASGQMLWGLPVVVTTAMTAGTALIGAFDTCAQVFRKGGITVEFTNSNEDDFKNNLIAIRAEERLALAVYRAGGFGTVTGIA